MTRNDAACRGCLPCETLDPKPESSPQRRMKQRPGRHARQVPAGQFIPSRTTSPAMTAGSAKIILSNAY